MCEKNAPHEGTEESGAEMLIHRIFKYDGRLNKTCITYYDPFAYRHGDGGSVCGGQMPYALLVSATKSARFYQPRISNCMSHSQP
jgi:hypothetical protein